MIAAYQQLYPIAVILMAIVAALSCMVGGLYAFVAMVVGGREVARLAAIRDAKKYDMAVPEATPVGYMLSWIVGGTTLFVGACLVSMLCLKIGAWIASIGC